MMDDMLQNRDAEIKRRFQLWLKPSVLKLAEDWYEKDNCKSKSEFIEKAIQFYSGYLAAGHSQNYFPRVLTSTLQAIVAESESRVRRMLFKLAVELAMTMNVAAAAHHIDPERLPELRKTCVDSLIRTNGSYTLEDAYRFQNP